MPEAPTITLITVVRNNVATIEKTLQSVAQQTSDAYEYIIMDGQSTDGTLEVIARYGSVITHLESQKDDGPYDAMNRAMQQASGTYIGFLNADDWLAEHAVASLCAAAKAYSQPEMIGFHLLEYKQQQDGILTPHRLFPDPDKSVFDLETGMYCHGLNHVYRADILRAQKRFEYERYGVVADRHMKMRLGMLELPKAHIEDVLYYFRVHAGSATTGNNLTHLIEGPRQYRRICTDMLSTHHDKEEVKAKLKRLYCFAAIREVYYLCRAGKAGAALRTFATALAEFPLEMVKIMVRPFPPTYLQRRKYTQP